MISTKKSRWPDFLLSVATVHLEGEGLIALTAKGYQGSSELPASNQLVCYGTAVVRIAVYVAFVCVVSLCFKASVCYGKTLFFGSS